MSSPRTLKNSPCFTKQDLLKSLKKSTYTTDAFIKRNLKSKKLIKLKKGLYTTSDFYFSTNDKPNFLKFLSSKICQPSYLSLEYVLKENDLLHGVPYNISCITTKSTRSFTNFLGDFKYSNIKPSLFFGFEKTTYEGHSYNVATKAKALFDYLYLNRKLTGKIKYLKQQLFKNLGINWTNFFEQDFKEFDKYVWKSNSKKMMKILRVINEYFESKNFDKWAKELFNS